MGRARWAALAITALAAALRFYHLGWHDLRGDEAFSVSFAQSQLDSLLQLLRTSEPHPPLYYLGLRLWLAVAGIGELAARWPSAAAGILACPLAYVAGRRLGSPRLGLLAALLLACNPYHIWHAQDARMYALATAACLLVVCCGLRLIEPERSPVARDFLALGLASALALYSHYVAATVVVAVALVLLGRLLLARPLPGRSLAGLVGAQGLALALFLPWLAVGLPTMGPGYDGNFASPALDAALLGTLLAFATGEAPPSAATYLVALALALAAGLGTFRLGRRRPWSAALLLAYLLVPFAALFLASRERLVFGEHYLLLVSPALYLLAAAGVESLWAARTLPRPVLAWRRGLSVLLAASLLAPLLAPLWGYYADRWGEGSGQWRPFVSRVAALAAPGDLVLVNHIDPSFFHYYRLLGGSGALAVAPARPGLGDGELATALSALAKPGLTVRFVPDQGGLWDGEGRVGQWLARRLLPLGEERVGGLQLLSYRLPAALPTPLLFGDELSVLGWEVPGAPASLRAGAEVTVDLLWSVSRAPRADYQVSLQLLDAAGGLVAQADGPLVGGTAPTSAWLPGEWVIDSRPLRLPTVRGTYTLGVAAYTLGNGQRLPVATAPSGLAPLGSIEIGR
ncbi:MAG: glycosyltransferase family 39 protein [Chloroflexota bacterium]